MLSAALATLLWILVLTTYGGEAALDKWHHHSVLDEKGLYHLYWNTENEYVVFKVEVATRGFIGFGFSPNGGMAGSDVVTGWIVDGKPYFQDRHGEGNLLPVADDSQDWELLGGFENDTHTTLIFQRMLQTCDEDDIEIDGSTMRIIYAFSDLDPTSEDDVDYHQGNRGTKSLILIGRGKLKDTSTEGLPYWDVLSPNYALTSSHHTMYWCKIFRSPQVTEKHHIVKVEPILQPGNEPYLHHINIYECLGATEEEYDPHVDKKGYVCFHPDMPNVMKKCDGLFATWAVGGESMVFPEHVGMPIENTSNYYMLEVHYENPRHHQGIVDQSGLRFYYTPNLRQYDAGTQQVGASWTSQLVIPPKRTDFVVVGHSSPECLDPVIPEGGLNIFAAAVHAHDIGKKIVTRHFRKEKELPPLIEDKYYDKNYQNYRFFQEEVKFLPGDQLSVECTYNSMPRSNTTFGGVCAQDEMCLTFLLYYPRIERFGSLSVPPASLIIDAIGDPKHKSLKLETPKEDLLHHHLEQYNWKKTDVDYLERTFRYSGHEVECILGNGNLAVIKNLITYPKITETYKKSSVCESRKVVNCEESISGSNRGSEALQITWATLLVALSAIWFLENRLLYQ